MKEESRTTKAIAALLRQTQDGTLKWQPIGATSDLTAGTEDVVETVYLAEAEGRLLRLFPFKTKYYTDEDVWHWDDGVALELSDEKHTSWWRFPKQPITWDLLEAVNFKTVGVDQFIDTIVSDFIPFEESTE